VVAPSTSTTVDIALARGLCVVMHNVSGFSRVPDLKVEDWL
jgi:predicted nucleic acid-binding protein